MLKRGTLNMRIERGKEYDAIVVGTGAAGGLAFPL